jgi:hypothetical protein
MSDPLRPALARRSGCQTAGARARSAAWLRALMIEVGEWPEISRAARLPIAVRRYRRLTEAHPVAPSPSPHSPGAERMRRHRARRREGKVCVMIELDPGAISGLMELGWLPGRQRDDRAAVIRCVLPVHRLRTRYDA